MRLDPVRRHGGNRLADGHHRARRHRHARWGGAWRAKRKAGDVPVAVIDLAGFLAGAWRIERRIADGKTGITGRLRGAACFTAAPGGLHYAEQGLLRFGAYQGEASQRYRFTLVTPAWAEVAFEDGRPFHSLDLSTGRATITHACAPDAYRGRYDVVSPDSWILVWVIDGPRKRLRIGTRYRRA